MKTILAYIILTFISSNLFFCLAQNQIPDTLIFEDKTYSLNRYILEDYFLKNPNKKPKSEIVSTNLWRGYVATFKFLDNHLFLKNIEIAELDTLNSKINFTKLDSIFSLETKHYNKKFKSVINTTNLNKIEIDWLTCLLVLPYGKKNKKIEYQDSVYENYLLLEISKGQLMKSINFTLEEFQKFKKLQYEKFKNTSRYNTEKRKLIKYYKKIITSDICVIDVKTCVDKLCESFIQDHITNYSTKILTD